MATERRPWLVRERGELPGGERADRVSGAAQDSLATRPLGSRAYLEGGGEDEYTLQRNRAAFDLLELLPDMPRGLAVRSRSARISGGGTNDGRSRPN